MLLSESTSRKAGCHERPSPAESGWNRSSRSAPRAHSRASALTRRPHPTRRGAPGPARRLGLRPHHAARTHRTAGLHHRSRRRPERTPRGRRRPGRRPARPGRPGARRRPRPGRHHRPRARPRRPRPHRDRAAQRHARTAGSWTGCRAAGRRRPDLMADPGRTRPAPPRGRRPPRLRRQLRPPRSTTDAARAGSAPPSGSTTRRAEPVERQRHLVGLYIRYAAEHLARLVELERARAHVATVAEELLPSRLPRVARRPAGRPPPHRAARRRRLVRRAAAARGRARPRRRLRHRLRAERGRRDGTAAREPAGVRRHGGRGPGRRALRPRTAAAR